MYNIENLENMENQNKTKQDQTRIPHNLTDFLITNITVYFGPYRTFSASEMNLELS